MLCTNVQRRLSTRVVRYSESRMEASALRVLLGTMNIVDMELLRIVEVTKCVEI